MKRRADWPEKLNAYLKAARSEQFAWGAFDCCLFAANAVKEMTGEDFAGLFRGQYNDAASAAAALEKFSGGNLVETLEKLSEQFGWEEVTPNYAQRGDILLLKSEPLNADPRFGGVLAICVGPMCAIAFETGVVFGKMGDAVSRAWHIR